MSVNDLRSWAVESDASSEMIETTTTAWIGFIASLSEPTTVHQHEPTQDNSSIGSVSLVVKISVGVVKRGFRGGHDPQLVAWLAWDHSTATQNNLVDIELLAIGALTSSYLSLSSSSIIVIVIYYFFLVPKASPIPPILLLVVVVPLVV